MWTVDAKKKKNSPTSPQARTPSLEDVGSEYNFAMQNLFPNPSLQTGSIAPIGFTTSGSDRIYRNCGTKERCTKPSSGCRCKNQLMNFAALHKLSFAGFLPTVWRQTSFKILPQTMRAKSSIKSPSHCNRTSVVFTYCVHERGRVENELETHQPEEQHGFQGGTRVEEHLVTTHLVLGKFPKVNVPIWIVSEDLSKAFD